MSDVICDFCHGEWVEERPMIEGHHGSCLCGSCLSVAYTEVILNQSDSGPPGYTCTMCLEQRGEAAWQSPLRAEAVICRRCIKLASGALSKEATFGWKPPVADRSGA